MNSSSDKEHFFENRKREVFEILDHLLYINLDVFVSLRVLQLNFNDFILYKQNI